MVQLSNLNTQQKDAVLSCEGPIMILAGAGSGKTRTLVTRISYLLDEKRISPFKILALTFSNKAAKEMRERVGRTVNEDIGALQITTFHAFCAKILRSEVERLGLSKSFTIYDTSESKSIAKSILGRHGIGPKEVSPFEVLYFKDDLQNIGYYPGVDEEHFDIDKSDAFFAYYTEYLTELKRANAMDFGGLITGVLELFDKYPEVLARYQKRFEYILVDEYQDTNKAQFELVKKLADGHRNLCVVGDEDQSIYSWRGADISNILDFEEEFEDAKLLRLEQNYRSSKTIIEAASFVISYNTQRKGKAMWTQNPNGSDITILECPSDREEGELIADEIKEIAEETNDFNDFAVFYRNNSQSRLLEESLRKLNIPYRVVGGIKFYERKEIKDLIAYLRLFVNPKDSLAFTRIINVPTRGIGAVSIRKMEESAIKNGCSLWETVTDMVENPENYSHIRLSAKVKSSLREFVALISECQVLEGNKEKPSLIFEKILHESGLWEKYQASKDYESQARLENIQELASAIGQYEENHSHNPSLGGFLELITLDSAVDQESEDKQKGEVSLMTIHGAKGLEFPYVYLTGVEENIFPSIRSLEENDMGLEEERRLFYVAMTRAMKKLTISFAQGRMLFGQVRFNGYSRFIDEIPNKFYEWKKVGRRNEFSQESSWEEPVVDREYDDDIVHRVDSVSSKKSFSPEIQYPTGSKILHSLYGEGKVIQTDGFGSEEKVTIKFKDGAKKKFMVKFAPLSSLE